MSSRDVFRDIGRAAKRGSDSGALVFVALAEGGLLPEVFNATTLAEHAGLFESYVPHTAYTAGQIRRDTDGVLYKCNQSHGAEHAADKPLSQNNLWQRLADPADEYPAWFPATGTFDQWPPGAKCSHKGKRWVNSLSVNNVWEPGTTGAGWVEVG